MQRDHTKRSVLYFLAVVALLSGHTCVFARARPDIKNRFDPVERSGKERICKVTVWVRNNDSSLLSFVVVPCDQGSWHWREPASAAWRRSWIDIKSSARAGVGAWRSQVHQDLWPPPSERAWIGECELGGIEKDATIEIVFFILVDDTLDLTKRPFRLGYGTCGEDIREWRPVYWSTAGEMPLGRSRNLDTMQVYEYVGCSDTVVLYNMSGVTGAEASYGWEVAEMDSSHVVFVAPLGGGPAEFRVICRDSVGTTGLINWRDGVPNANSGSESGPGTAQYSLVDTVAVYREPQWPNLLLALVGAGVLLLGVTIVLRLRVPRRR